MMRSTLRHIGALLVAAMFLAALMATIAAPVSAAKATCAGRRATIVGTGKGEVIRGTAKADVIAAKGGNDTVFGRGGNDVICGGEGHDRLVGGAGRDILLGEGGRDRLAGGPGLDRLVGGPANDSLNGGSGNDACLQGTGSGPRVNCERPPEPVPPPPPPPAGPTHISMSGILAVAYSDIDGLDGYSTGDVLIARLMDANGDLVPSIGDSIEMGRYPTDFNATAFGDWLDKGHVVTAGVVYVATNVSVGSASSSFTWYAQDGAEYYQETGSSGSSYFVDGIPDDSRKVEVGSPSAPQVAVTDATVPRAANDPFIDVTLNYPVP